MSIIGGIAGTLFLLFSFAWALLPGGFGISNYKKTHGPVLSMTGMLLWLLLILLHPVVLYLLWNGLLNDKEIVYSWLLAPLAYQVIFFKFFARNVGT